MFICIIKCTFGIDIVPNFMSISNFMNDESITPILKQLIKKEKHSKQLFNIFIARIFQFFEFFSRKK